METLQKYVGTQMSGKNFKDLIGDEQNYLIKFMNNDDVHYGLKYETGLNIDTCVFKPNDVYGPGGIHFCHISNYHKWYTVFGNSIRRVTIEDRAKIFIGETKIKADRVILSEKEGRDDILGKLLTQYCVTSPVRMQQLLQQCGFAIEFIAQKYRTHEMMMMAVRQNGKSIRYIQQEYRTYEMMIEAVKQDGDAIAYIQQKYRTHELMMIAVKQNGYALELIDPDFRSEDMILEARKKIKDYNKKN